jgi:hypothetical protein
MTAKRTPATAALTLAALMLMGLPADAEPPGHTVRVGVLTPIVTSFDPATNRVAKELFAGLRELGYTPGLDIVFEFRSV